jgi:hypothetical protein
MKSRPNVAGDDLLPPSKSGLLASLDLLPPSKNAILALLPLAEETADNSKVVVVSKISHSKTLAEDVKNCQDYLLPPSKSSLLTSLLVALLPCKLGSKEGTKDVDKLLRGRDVDKLLASNKVNDLLVIPTRDRIMGVDLLPPSKSALIALLPLALLPCKLQGRFSLALQPGKLDGQEGEYCTVTLSTKTQ